MDSGTNSDGPDVDEKSLHHSQDSRVVSSEYDESVKDSQTDQLEPGLADLKTKAILEACERNDLDRLVELALSKGGYLTTDLRQRVWPILLGTSSPEANGKPLGEQNGHPTTPDLAANEANPHRDEEQVAKDVDRAFVHYPRFPNPAAKDRRKQELSALILGVLRRYPFLNYFQGYHDICQVFLLVLPPPQQVPAVARLSALRIRDYMCSSMDPVMAQLCLIPDILRRADPVLFAHVRAVNPYFALASTLTLYAHDVTSLGEISRLFDVLLAREPAFSLYMYAATVLRRRDDLLAVDEDDTDVLHVLLSKLPRPLDLDDLVASASALFAQHPPESLPSWRGLSGASAVRTARSLAQVHAQTVEWDGLAFFAAQERELLRAKTRERRIKLAKALARRYRRPGAVGLAIAVGALALWLRRSPGFASAWSQALSTISRWSWTW